MPFTGHPSFSETYHPRALATCKRKQAGERPANDWFKPNNGSLDLGLGSCRARHGGLWARIMPCPSSTAHFVSGEPKHGPFVRQSVAGLSCHVSLGTTLLRCGGVDLRERDGEHLGKAAIAVEHRRCRGPCRGRCHHRGGAPRASIPQSPANGNAPNHNKSAKSFREIFDPIK